MRTNGPYEFLIPSPVNHLFGSEDSDVPLHHIGVWKHNTDPMYGEEYWVIQYRFDDETYFETRASTFYSAMLIVRSMLVDACDMGEPCPEALRTEYEATWGINQ